EPVVNGGPTPLRGKPRERGRMPTVLFPRGFLRRPSDATSRDTFQFACSSLHGKLISPTRCVARHPGRTPCAGWLGRYFFLRHWSAADRGPMTALQNPTPPKGPSASPC